MEGEEGGEMDESEGMKRNEEVFVSDLLHSVLRFKTFFSADVVFAVNRSAAS